MAMMATIAMARWTTTTMISTMALMDDDYDNSDVDKNIDGGGAMDDNDDDSNKIATDNKVDNNNGDIKLIN